jgi:MFS family permease
MTFGLLQRLPYLVAGLVLWFMQDAEAWLLPVVVLTPFISGLIGGIGVVAWMEMVTRMVPERVRAAGWAARYIMQACIGMAAGAVIQQVLTHAPGQRGYAVLHLIAFAFLLLSWISQAFMRGAARCASLSPAYWLLLEVFENSAGPTGGPAPAAAPHRGAFHRHGVSHGRLISHPARAKHHGAGPRRTRAIL